MAKFNEYPAKTTPKDADKFMLYSAEDAANKLIDYDKLADAVLNKLTSKTFGLDAGTMTLPAALNQLNSKSNVDTETIYYTDSEWSSLGGTDECVKDAVNKNRIPLDGIFCKQFTAGARYLMFGYRYANGKYGTIILYKYDQTGDARYSITNGSFFKVK